ncbi:hypothetical protein JDV02_010369 [Purpureocillium takamizusanense]|uniref:Pesticidal crystal protein domain-containing protein n=1 Tax=Purpureocillium takamizusanense TaxID=2060973 RepID=A0A9Q8VGJ6_9HYPO|nr:uncharacterized protein JDV02_010369 [Purpureocillium takamizusanense]UNI24636.1 hypothetical protein JDV02_010369 [Purpureocillium takamizusanense]
MFRIRWNEELMAKAVAGAKTAAEEGRDLGAKTPAEAAQYVCTFFACCAGLVPQVGFLLEIFGSLFGSVFGAPDSNEEIWEALRKKIENLIDCKIEEHHKQTLKDTIDGLKNYMKRYQQFCVNFEKAPEDQKAAAALNVLVEHIAFLGAIELEMPHFRSKGYESWGYIEANIEGIRQDFVRFTSRGAYSHAQRGEYISQQASTLAQAITKGEELGFHAETLDIWRMSYTDLLQSSKVENEYKDMSYVSYVLKIYENGRKQVQPYAPSKHYPEALNIGITEAEKLRAYADYDS